MKALLRLFFAIFILIPFGVNAQSPAGTWKISVPDDTGKMIPMKVDISENGTYTLDYGADGTVETKGKYSVAGGKMTIQDTEGSDCTQPGLYTLKIEGHTMTMTRVSEGCANRGGPEGIMTLQRG